MPFRLILNVAFQYIFPTYELENRNQNAYYFFAPEIYYLQNKTRVQPKGRYYKDISWYFKITVICKLI